MAYLDRDEADPGVVRQYLLEALEFSFDVHDSGSLEWHNEPGYVQWGGWPGGVQIGCSGESFLGRSYTADEQRRLRELGFSPPDEDDDLPNYWRRFTSHAELPLAADVLVTILFEILTPPSPEQLRAFVAAAEDGPAPEPTSSVSGDVVTLGPLGKIDRGRVHDIVETMTRLMAQGGPVAIVDAHQSSGLGLPGFSGALDGPRYDVPAPASPTDRLVLSGWSGGDHDRLVLLRAAAAVADTSARLAAAGWRVLLVGPLVFHHTLWAYERAALPLSDALLLVCDGWDWDHQGHLVQQLLDGPQRAGAVDPLAVVLVREQEEALAVGSERRVSEAELLKGPDWLSQWLSPQALTAHLPADPSPARPLIDVPVVLLRVSREWYPGIDEDQLYDVTHGWWVMGPKRERAEYALAVAKGQVRGTYRIHGWRPRHADPTADGKVRWGFDGEPADELAHLIGLDVTQYFPAGAANPVRYVNCEDVAAGPAAKAKAEPAVTEPVQSSSRSAALARTCAELWNNPVLHLSLGSKELFHSNLIGWLLESDRALAMNALVPWLESRPAQQQFDVRREDHDLDLVVQLPAWAPLVIENKVFSLPDEDQLDRYAEHNAPAAGLTDPTLLLLSLTDPGWPDRAYNGWRWMPYGDLAHRIRQALDDRPDVDPFTDELVKRWVDMVRLLETLTSLVEPVAPEEPLLLHGEDVEVLRTVRLHDVLQKARTRRVRHLLEQRFAQADLPYDFIESEFTSGGPLLSAAVDLSDGCRIGWQLQGSQFRRFLIVAEELAGPSAAQKLARIRHADDHHRAWFGFGAEHALGPFGSAPTSAYKHFAPDFLYDYIKVPGITVQQVLYLGELTLRQALDYREASRPAT
jgi:hypothetical protein